MKMLYSNFIGAEMDYILDYDKLNQGLPLLLEQLKISFNMHEIKTPHEKYEHFYTDYARNQVLSLHKDELKKYNLSFGKGRINGIPHEF